MKNLNKGEIVGIAVAVLAVLYFMGGLLTNRSVKVEDTSSNTNTNTVPIVQNDTTMESKELIIEDSVVGTGAEALAGKTVRVHYTGTLTNGTKFDSSLDRGEPIEFVLGTGYVIQGWEQGILGMKVGGTRQILIPSDLGYGEQGTTGIPPNSDLVFTVSLLNVSN